MTLPQSAAPSLTIPSESSGEAMYQLVADLFPIHRCITGPGLRQTLRRLQEKVPLHIHEVPSGTQVGDWIVPPEWTIREAWIRDSSGRTLLDLAWSNLHVVQYSASVRRKMSLVELQPHLHTLPDQPNAIPYKTTYYDPGWGFCLEHARLQQWPQGQYEVAIDATLAPGALSYGELQIPGESPDEVLFTSHVCHPSLANDNLAAVAVAVQLALDRASAPRKYSYRFVFAPGTIGAIAWLSRNRHRLKHVRHACVLTLLGNDAPLSYKRSRGLAGPDKLRRPSILDRVFEELLSRRPASRLVAFSPTGYDERQYNSPGVGLAAGCLRRSGPGGYPEYHTSLDNLSLISPCRLQEAFELLREACDMLESRAATSSDPPITDASRGVSTILSPSSGSDPGPEGGRRRFRNLHPFGEPQLGRRGVVGACPRTERSAYLEAIAWLLNFSDGQHDLNAIADLSHLPRVLLSAAAGLLVDHGLLEDCVL